MTGLLRWENNPTSRCVGMWKSNLWPQTEKVSYQIGFRTQTLLKTALYQNSLKGENVLNLD